MLKKKVFISSVKLEFANERQMLFDYIKTDKTEKPIPSYHIYDGDVFELIDQAYTSNGSIQVMLYKNRLETWNPGQLPYGIEQVGTGTEMIIEKCVEKSGKKTTQKILEAIRQNSKITRSELSKITGVSDNGIKWNLNKLKNEGILERIGADKGGYWKLN